MLDKIIIIDFEDSFTYNIASVLYRVAPEQKVVSHAVFFEKDYYEVIKSHQKIAIILGPGPGHPREFEKYFDKLSALRSTTSIFVMGICLGHQILGLMDGFEIKDAIEKVHGQTRLVNIQNEQRIVQRYNSLSVFEKDKELDVRTFERGVSYQFHPESVGTQNNILYFKSLLEFIRSH